MPHDDDIITVSTYDAVSAADGDSSILPSGFQELSPVDSPDGNDPGFNYPIQGAAFVGYQHVHDTTFNLKNRSPHILLPTKKITVKIVNYERLSSNLLNPNLYTIEVEHGNYRWTVKRRYKHFQNLNQQLQLLKASLNIPFPTKSHREQRASFKTIRVKTVGKQVPRFPLRPERLIPADQMDMRVAQLENYLKAVLENSVYRQYHETLSFLEISRISFISQLGHKGKEGLIKKRSGDTSLNRFNTCMEDGLACFCCCCLNIFQSWGNKLGSWKRRWLFIKDSFIGYLRPDTGEIGGVLLMDHDFKVSTGLAHTGLKNGLIISNLSRQMLIREWTKRKVHEWVDDLQVTMNTTGKDFIHQSRFGSFAPLRTDGNSTWFVDGCSFMSAVADAIESAEEEVMIADWWLSPEIYMKRPVFHGDRWRLDTLLQRKAEEGVLIFIMLYKEVELALGINSLYSKKALCSKHPNIKILRHPDHVAGKTTLLWAHHEKLVIIDQSLAFVGGIDLCYGRWDDEQHRLTDLGSVGTTQRPIGALTKIQSSSTVGQQLPNTLLQLAKSANLVTMSTVANTALLPPPVEKRKAKKKAVEFNRTNNSVIEVDPAKEETHKLGRRATVVNKMRNFAVELADKGRHLKEDSRDWMGKHLKSSNKDEGSEIDPNEIAPIKTDETNIDEDSSPHPKRKEEQLLKKNSTTQALQGFQGSTKLWIGKDYTNFIVKDFVKLDQPLQDFVDRATTPRMPWHDIACAVTGKAARDVARHFIQRWNAIKVEKVKDNPRYPFLVPKSYEDFPLRYKIQNDKSTCANCQVLRSSTTWSLGTRTTEDSIMTAYVHSIQNAKHYVYIENQFFITLAGSSDEVTNRIGKALFERIITAHLAGSRFRVYVVMPLLPGFEGQIGTTSGIAMQAILHWNYASICRGKDSLLGRLRDANIDPLNYISFYALRTHSELNDQLVTELIYVHSKLMIVDDNLVICGSANINDRSLTGKRDSEVALIIQDVNFEPSIMDGQPYQAGKFASSLRRQLFREHLGLLKSDSENEEIDIADPVADSFYKGSWLRIASINTKIYEQVFRCIPCDDVTTFAQLREFQSQLPLAFTEPNVAKQKLAQIQGTLVLLPLQFLSQENLTPAAGTAEALMPTSLWT